MPGGLEGRLLREQIRSQRLQNAQRAMQLAGPLQQLQELALAQDVTQMFPEQLRAQMLGNEAREYANSRQPEMDQQAMAAAAEQLKAAQFMNANAEEDRQRAYDRSQQELSLRDKAIDYSKINGLAGLFSTAGAYNDISEPLQNYIESLGITGSFKPLNLFGGGNNEAVEKLYEVLGSISNNKNK